MNVLELKAVIMHTRISHTFLCKYQIAGVLRQHNCCHAYQQARGHTVLSSLLEGQEIDPSHTQTQSSPQNQTHLWEKELIGGHVVTFK